MLALGHMGERVPDPVNPGAVEECAGSLPSGVGWGFFKGFWRPWRGSD
jgi:hypothetical protein